MTEKQTKVKYKAYLVEEGKATFLEDFEGSTDEWLKTKVVPEGTKLYLQDNYGTIYEEVHSFFPRYGGPRGGPYLPIQGMDGSGKEGRMGGLKCLT